ncbi:MAG: TrkA family potassium uptake protein [Firmicutes bacterium]|nr:TrkA family potassium uptake protein [Bacillota bacterium]MCL5038789.1 TrkA family potassium uptake protein [Bacillota bacterium]
MRQFVVIGLGRFGSSVAKTLHAMGYEVLGVDNHSDRIQGAASYLTHVVQADATDEEVLKNLGIRNFDCAVVSIGEDIQASILVTVLLKEMGIKYVVAKALNDLHAKVLSKIGADRIVFPEREMGARVAHNLVSSHVLDYIQLSPDHNIVEVEASPDWNGKTLRHLNFRSRFGVNVLAIKRGKQINVSPTADDVVMAGDILVVVGETDNLRRLEEY